MHEHTRKLGKAAVACRTLVKAYVVADMLSLKFEVIIAVMCMLTVVCMDEELLPLEHRAADWPRLSLVIPDEQVLDSRWMIIPS
jgi:hypothetical protein